MEQLYNKNEKKVIKFDERTQVLYQSPCVKETKIPNEKKLWILTPMVAYKVLVPYPKEKELNFFQETILKLFLSGNKTTDYISEKLLLDKKLVSFIIDQLVEKELLNEDGIVTSKGKNILNEINNEYDLKTGYIFYDLVNKNYSDTFVFDGELGFTDSKYGKEYRVFDYGSAGKPREAKAQVVKINKLDFPEEPTNVEILEVCIKHKRRINSLKRGGYYNSDEKNKLPSNLEKVKFLGDITPVYLATFIFLPNDLQNNSYWQICHPFFGGTSIRLRENIEILSQNDENRHIREAINLLINDNLNVDLKEISLFEDKKDKEAKIFLVDVLSKNILNYPGVFNKLVRTKTLLNQVQNKKGSKGNNYEENQKRLGDCLINLHEAIEDALHILKNNYSDYFNIDILTKDKWKNAEILSLIASQCGFIDKNNVFLSMFNLKQGSVKYAGTGDSKEMKSLIALNLLIAREIEDHPFRVLGKKVPSAIRFLYDLYKRRNINKHTVYEDDDKLQVENTFIRVLYILYIIFDDLQFKYNENVTFYRDGFSDSDIDRKLRILAESTVENKIGLIIREYDVIRKTLIEADICRRSWDDDFIVHCSKCLENLFLIIDRKIINKNAQNIICNNKYEHLNYLSNELNKNGFKFIFNLDELPDSFKQVDTWKIINTFDKLENGVLSTRLYVMLYSAIMDNNNMVFEISKAVPELILFASKINDLRGHGNSWGYEKNECKEIYDELLSIIKKILEILNKNNIK